MFKSDNKDVIIQNMWLSINGQMDGWKDCQKGIYDITECVLGEGK